MRDVVEVVIGGREEEKETFNVEWVEGGLEGGKTRENA